MSVDESTLGVQLQTPSGAWVDVGMLHNRDEWNWFEISEHYWNSADRPVLGQVFEEHGQAWRPSARVALPTWFSHLLPEGRLREEAAAAAHINPRREFQLLARIGGADLPGAVRVLPAEGPALPKVPESVNDEESSEENNPLLKFSLAGLQLKFSVLAGDKGLAFPARGEAGNVIVKLPDGRAGFDSVPEAELGSLMLAKAVGVRTPRAWLTEPSSIQGLERWTRGIKGKVLAVERFDRSAGNRRIHMEEFAQVLNVSATAEHAKYKTNFETIALVATSLCGEAAGYEAIDRIVLNVLIGNGDAHLKNWSIVYEDGKRPTLSPVYDVLPTVLYIANDDLGPKLNGTRDFRRITVASFDRLAKRSGLDPAAVRSRIRALVERVRGSFPMLKDHLSRKNYQELSARLDRLPLARPHSRQDD